MISWQSIMSVFNTKGTLLKWLKTLDQSLKDGVLESVTVNSVSEGVITLSFNFADGSVITTPQIDIPQGAQGPEGPQGVPGADGADGTDGRDALVQNRALSSANITSPMAVPIEALNRSAVVGEPIVMFATDTTENKTYMLIGTVTDVGSPGGNPYIFVTYSSKVEITGMTGPEGPDIFTDFDNLKIDTTDATVAYINGVATITNARLIGYKSGGNEEVEISVDLPIKAGDNVTVDASEDDKSLLISVNNPSSVLYDYSSPDPSVNWGRTYGIRSGTTVVNALLSNYSVYRVYIRLSDYTAVCLATSNNMNFVTTFTGVTEGNDGIYAMRFKIASNKVTVESTGYFGIPSFAWNNRPGDTMYCIYKIEGVL